MRAADGFDLKLNLQRALRLRWGVLLLQSLAVASAPTFFGLTLPWLPLLLTLALSLGFNAITHQRLQKDIPVDAGELFGQIAVDMILLAVFLHFSGGVANPLSLFILMSVVVGALSLPMNLALAAAGVAGVLFLSIAWLSATPKAADVASLAQFHTLIGFIAAVTSLCMLTWFIVRTIHTNRERDIRLVVGREKTLRDERLIALSKLAAHADHELHEPLAAIAAIIDELEQEVFLNAEVHADLALVRRQLHLCHDIVGDLAREAGALHAEERGGENGVEIAPWLQAAVQRWLGARPNVEVRISLPKCMMDENAVSPPVAKPAVLERALTSLLDNAADNSEAEIRLSLHWDEERLVIAIHDSGPGFPSENLHHGGHAPRFMRRRGEGNRMLTAFSLIRQLGGKVVLDNPLEGGGRVSIELPR